MYCKYCGEMIDDDSRFCPCCGKDLGSSSEIYRLMANKADEEMARKANTALKLAWASIITIPLIIVPAILAFIAIIMAKEAKYSKSAEVGKKAKRIAYISYFIVAAIVIAALCIAINWYVDWIMEYLNY